MTLVGWIFDGWFTDELGGSQVEGWNAGTKTSDITVYAHWTADTVNYTVKKYFQTVSGDGYEQNLSLYPNQTKVGTTETSSNAEAEDIVKGIYDTFNAKRKQLDAQQADAEDIKMLEDLEKSIIEKQNDYTDGSIE